MADLQIGGEAYAEWAPGNFVVSVGNGTPNAAAVISIDGAATGQDTVLGPDGTLANLTVVLFNRYLPGTHTLTITTSNDTGSRTFTIAKQVPVPASSSTPPTPTAPLSPGRWQFEDPVLHETHVFAVNPQTSTSPYPARSLTEQQTTTGHALTSEGNPHSMEWVLEGYIADQAQYDALDYWSNKPYRLFVTDDLGRQYVGVILEFAPIPYDPQHVADANFSRGTYGMTIEVLKEVTS